MKTGIVKIALQDYIDGLKMKIDAAKVEPSSGDLMALMWNTKRAEEALVELDARVNSFELSQKGGAWLGAVREWIKCKFRNGEHVTWGSQEVLEGRHMTVIDFESLAATIAAAAINEDRRN